MTSKVKLQRPVVYHYPLLTMSPQEIKLDRLETRLFGYKKKLLCRNFVGGRLLACIFKTDTHKPLDLVLTVISNRIKRLSTSTQWQDDGSSSQDSLFI
ncbi:12861_t:CDS:2 [Funneliformis caledonium]|uniref:12861_t:CDS:1 n=1 Tax=Funneliformis caledonium TaxID=1117310 RepID=A0A9N9CMH9_9GLOM|nr:12861_t:CDS:2 [Funneliformis caledonium]